MATTKVWVGTTGDFQLASNWRAVSIRSPAYAWTASGSGTGEYYLRTVGGTDPGILEPPTVTANGVALTGGSAGTLAASRWDYADNDTLGYSTIYVRLADDADPDSKAAGYVTYNDVPRTGDSIEIPVSSGTITSNLDLSGTTLAKVTGGAGQSTAIGSATGYLRLKCTGFEWNAGGIAYIDLHDSAIAPIIKGTATPSTGGRGLYLKGSALTTLSIEGGDTGLAWLGGDTATVATVRITGNGTLWIGGGASVTTLQVEDGTALAYCGLTTLTQLGGTVRTEGSGTITTVNTAGGNFVPNSTGTITTHNVTGGNTDWYGTGSARTVSTTNLKRGGSWTVGFNIEAVTYTAIAVTESQKISGGTV